MLIRYCQQKSVTPIKNKRLSRFWRFANTDISIGYEVKVKYNFVKVKFFSSIVFWDISRLCTRISPWYVELILAPLLRVSSGFPPLAQQLNLSWGETNCPLRSLPPPRTNTRFPMDHFIFRTCKPIRYSQYQRILPGHVLTTLVTNRYTTW